MKHIHSQDPIKPLIVAAIKRKAHCTKVTCVEQRSDGTYSGQALRRKPGGRNAGYHVIGIVFVTQEELAAQPEAAACPRIAPRVTVKA